MKPPSSATQAACGLALLLAACGAGAAEVPGGEAAGVAFVVLPVTSDEEGLGTQVERMLRKKARRLGALVYDPASVTGALEGRALSPTMPPAALETLARERFEADVAVVGHVAGTGKDYVVHLLAVATDPKREPRVLEKRWPCAYHQIIPLEMAKAVREVLGLPPVPEQTAADAASERRWREGPNLVANPGFETPAPGRDGPDRWQAIEREMAWVAGPDGPGKVLKYEMSGETAAGYGLDFYSDWIEIEAGATYRFSVRIKTLGPTPKIFLKGYHPFPAMDGYPAQRRETYRRQVHPGGPKGAWQTVVADFVPSATRPEHLPTHLKVDLYAYWPKGVVYWDDVVLKKIRPAPEGPPPR